MDSMKISIIAFAFLAISIQSLPFHKTRDSIRRISEQRNSDIQEELFQLEKGFEAYASFHGFQLKTYVVPTEDGVLLTVHRITQPKIFIENSTSVLLSHGFASSSFDFMANPRNESLAFILADHGYDVWAINYRGSHLSSRTIHGDSPSADFYYDATWQNMAKYDLPAVLDFILSKKNNKPLHIIGQSMGTSAVFGMLASNHNYDDKISLFHALTPVSAIGNDTSASLKRLFAAAVKLPTLFRTDFGYDLAYGRPILDGKGRLSKTLFSNKLCLMSSSYCEDLTGILFDRERNLHNPHIRKERYPLYFAKYPAGATMSNVYLFSTQLNRYNWTMMDYDQIRLPGKSNMQEYAQNSAPEYDFDSIKVKMTLHYSMNDVFTGNETARMFGERMKPHLFENGLHFVDGNRFSHQDSLWAWDARCYMYNQVLEDLKSFETDSHYRNKIENFVQNLPFQDGCNGLRK